jgi:anti-anti-sigma factor
MEITRTRRQGILQLGLLGRIDFSEAAVLERELSSLIAAGENRLVMDFNEVTSVSSHGLRVMMRISKELSQRRGKLVLHSLSADVRRSFDTTGIALILRICNSSDEALASVGNTGMLPACPIRK